MVTRSRVDFMRWPLALLSWTSSWRSSYDDAPNLLHDDLGDGLQLSTLVRRPRRACRASYSELLDPTSFRIRHVFRLLNLRKRFRWQDIQIGETTMAGH
jgi:hypothetical protein